MKHTIELTDDEVYELLYWHSETPDPGDEEQPDKEKLKEKLRLLVEPK